MAVATTTNLNYTLENFANNPNSSLDASEILELLNLEAKVEKSLKAFVEIGLALRSIRDKRLYRENHSTFEDYCINRWEISMRSSYYLIAAASLVENFVNHGSQNVPNSERICRPLTSLAPEKQLTCWHQAIETAPEGKITSSHVAQVVRDYKQQIKESKKCKNNSNLLKEGEMVNVDRVDTKTCWSCQYSSGELIKEDPHKFYCYKLGKLDFIEKNGEDRAKECEFWTERNGSKKDIFTPITLPLKKEEFTLTLQLPANWQEKMEKLATERDLDVTSWVTQILAKSIRG